MILVNSYYDLHFNSYIEVINILLWLISKFFNAAHENNYEWHLSACPIKLNEFSTLKTNL